MARIGEMRAERLKRGGVVVGAVSNHDLRGLNCRCAENSGEMGDALVAFIVVAIGEENVHTLDTMFGNISGG